MEGLFQIMERYIRLWRDLSDYGGIFQIMVGLFSDYGRIIQTLIGYFRLWWNTSDYGGIIFEYFQWFFAP